MRWHCCVVVVLMLARYTDRSVETNDHAEAPGAESPQPRDASSIKTSEPYMVIASGLSM